MSEENWLKRIRQQADISRQQLADDSGLGFEQIKYWEKPCSPKNPLHESYYAKLAAVLGCRVDKLKQEHKKDMEQRALEEEKNKTESARAKNATKANLKTYLILRALDALVKLDTRIDQAFLAELYAELEVSNNSDATTKIEEILRRGDGAGISDKFNPPLEKVITDCEQPLLSAKDCEQCKTTIAALRRLIGAVAINTVVPDEQWKQGGEYVVKGKGQAWLIRLHLNHLLGFDISDFKAKDSTCLDNEQTRALVTPGETQKENVEEQLYAAVCEFIKREQPLQNMPKNPAENPKAFKEDCKKLNNTLLQKNRLVQHAFILMLEQRDSALPSLIREYFPNIRAFKHEKSEFDDPSVLYDSGILEAWLAFWLHRIDNWECRSGTHAATQQEEKATMHEQASSVVNNYNLTNSNLSMGNNNHQNAVGRDQINSQADLQQITDLLQELLKNTDPDDANHVGLRGRAMEIQNSIAQEKKLPKQAKTWLEQATQGVKLAQPLMDIAERLKGFFS